MNERHYTKFSRLFQAEDSRRRPKMPISQVFMTCILLGFVGKINLSVVFWQKGLLAASMQITVNGKARECREGMLLSDLLTELRVKREGIAVEVNRKIVPKSKHVTTPIREGDAIEIVTFVGGG